MSDLVIETHSLHKQYGSTRAGDCADSMLVSSSARRVYRAHAGIANRVGAVVSKSRDSFTEP
jgi:hypothetical protein